MGVLLLLRVLVAVMLLAGGWKLLEAPDGSSSAVGRVGVVAGRRLAKASSSPTLALKGGEPLLPRGLGRRLGLLLHWELLPTLLHLQPASIVVQCGTQLAACAVLCPTKGGSASVMWWCARRFAGAQRSYM